MEKFELIKSNMEKSEQNLSKYACLSKDAIRLKKENLDIRTDFERDIDKIIHTLPYTRYSNKTQVYTCAENDNISTRMTHVQFVSRAARTIARALNLNEDLCEAIALGHDIGHVPYGHVGERILSDICKEKLGITFAHNVQSVRTFTNIEKNGNGLNLTLQVLDGILCHNGEMLSDKYYPEEKDYDKFLKEYNDCYKNSENIKKLRPMTLEGCIVRISDIIGYIGKDIDDAIRLKMLKLEDIPQDIRTTLGTKNNEIMNSIILDIINESFDKPYIKMSKKVNDAVVKLKKFNYEYIYDKACTDERLEQYKNKFYHLFNVYEEALKNNDTSNDIYGMFLNSMNENYNKNTVDGVKIVDFISGMTDNFFESQYIKYS